jgi:hypothetical protein
MENKCDICDRARNTLDYFANICSECRSKHTDMVLLKKIGRLKNQIEDMKSLKK